MSIHSQEYIIYRKDRFVCHTTSESAKKSIMANGFKTGKELNVAERRSAVFFADRNVNKDIYARNKEGEFYEGENAAYICVNIKGLKLLNLTVPSLYKQYKNFHVKGELELIDRDIDGTIMFLEDGRIYEVALKKDIANKVLIRDMNEGIDDIVKKYKSIPSGEDYQPISFDIDKFVNSFDFMNGRATYFFGYPYMADYLNELFGNPHYEIPHNITDIKQQYSNEFGEELTEEQIGDLMDYIKKIAKDYLQDFIKSYDRKNIDGQQCVLAYRKLSIDDSTDIYEEYGGIGIYWAFDREYAEAHWWEDKMYEVVLYGAIPVKNIDWNTTFFHNMSMGFDESEVNCYKGSNVYVLAIEVDSEMKKFRKPIKVKA